MEELPSRARRVALEVDAAEAEERHLRREGRMELEKFMGLDFEEEAGRDDAGRAGEEQAVVEDTAAASPVAQPPAIRQSHFDEEYERYLG